jgi:hypothetical protein
VWLGIPTSCLNVRKAGIAMDIVRSATQLVTGTANAAAATMGAAGGAALGGIVGAAQGTATGVRNGMNDGRESTPAALLTLGAVGATGLVEWPVLLTVGGAALLLRQFGRRDHADGAAERSAGSTAATKTSQPRKTTSSRGNRSSKRPRSTASRRRR